MTFVHIRLSKVQQNDALIEYLVESFDFNEQREWEAIGKIAIDKWQQSYEFQPERVWSDRRIIPPSIYGLSEAEREQIVKSKYRDYGWGAWSMTVHHWAMSFIEGGSFPEYHPLAFFGDRSLTASAPQGESSPAPAVAS